MNEKIYLQSLVQDAIRIDDYTSNCGNNNKKSKQIFCFITWNEKCVSQNEHCVSIGVKCDTKTLAI